jgi:glycosyltransferase involved in cell wall biosynthesis
VKRRWSINGRFLTQPLTGVQRYACEIVQELDALLADGHPLVNSLEIDLLVPCGEARELRLNAVRTKVLSGTVGHLWEQTILPRHVGGGVLSLCNSGPVALSKQIVCVHDLNTRLYPASYSLQFRTLYRVLLPVLGRTANTITTVSRFSADQLVSHGISTADKIAVVPNGYEHALRWRPRHSKKTQSVAGPDTVVLLGSLAPHKNIGIVLGLAQDLAAAGLKIAVAGIGDARIFKANGVSHAADNIIWLGRLSDEELAALLTDSLCLAFPSLTEGFGLPALEAMALGCPVVATDQASVPEVCGDAVLFAAPDDREAWLKQILRLRRSAALREALIAKGRSRAKVFSWRKSAEQYLELIARADNFSLRSRRDLAPATVHNAQT